MIRTEGVILKNPNFFLKTLTNEGRNVPYCFLTGSEIKASLFLPDAVN